MKHKIKNISKIYNYYEKFVKKYRIRAINLPQKDEKMNGQLPNKSRICRDSQNGFKNLVKTEIV